MKNFKFTLILITVLFASNLSLSQVPDWILNAEPVKEEHLKKINKKGDVYLKKFESYPENSLEKKIYYRIKYIDYLKKMETFDVEINKISDSIKPIHFPIFISPDKNAKLKSLEIENKITLIKTDTIILVADLFNHKSTPIEKENNGFNVIVQGNKGKLFVLENAYNSYDLSKYPHFNLWKEKYYLYASKEAQKIKLQNEIEKDKYLKKQNELWELDKKRRDSVYSTISIDDFTGIKSIESNSHRFIQIENSGMSWFLKTINKGTKKYIDVFFDFGRNYSPGKIGIILKGSFVEFKLENNIIVKLPFVDTTTPVLKGQIAEFYNFLYLTEKNYLSLCDSKVKKIRIHFSKGYLDFDINDKASEIFIKQLKCVK